MILPNFQDSGICATRAHCQSCRSTDGSFRRNHAGKFSGLGENEACKHGYPWGWRKSGESPAPTPQPDGWSAIGPKLWAELHLRCLFIEIDSAAEAGWLTAFDARIPCGDCKMHWRAMIEASPPNVSSNLAYFQWSVDRHNEVNQRLQKPTIRLASARTYWDAHRRQFFNG